MGNFLSQLFGDSYSDNDKKKIIGNLCASGNVVISGNTVVCGGNTVVGNVSLNTSNTTTNIGTSSSTTTLNPSITTTVINNQVVFINQNKVRVNKHGIPLEFGDFLKEIYEAAHLYILLWFIIIYLVVYYALGFLLKNNEIQSIDLIMSRTFDLMILVPFTLFLLYLYYTASQDTKDHILIRIWDWTIEWMDDIMNFFGLILFMICFYLMIVILGIPTDKEKQPYSIHFLEGKIWIYIATFFILMFFKHFLKIDFLVITDKYVKEWTNTTTESTSKIQNYFTPISKALTTTTVKTTSSGGTATTTTTTTTTAPPTPTKMDEVFNVSNNLYTYEDAQQICSVYGAKLANYDQIEDAYNHGGEWCNYGWSEGQMAFFPTQTSTWNKLQKNPKTKNSCGRPGVNGGYIENPYIRFGVNCFGKKPDAKPSDLKKINQPVTVPKTQDEIAIDQKMKFWKDNADKLVQINTFNNTKWSEY